MELSELGFDEWFELQAKELQKPHLRAARVTRVDRDRYLVLNEHKETQAETTGNLLFSAESHLDLPCVGDWVLAQYHNDDTLAIIHIVLPRKTFLRRKTAGNKVDFQMIASNIDVAFIMQSCDSDFNLRRLERYLVIANEGRIHPIILLSKTDLVSTEDLQLVLSQINGAQNTARVIPFSSANGTGLDAIRQVMQRGKTYCLLGSSGVGKTTLMNLLLGTDEFATHAVREKDSRGRHTTTSRQLIVLDTGALLIDNPGMRELGMMAVGSGIDESFSEIHELSAHCRFKDCTHTAEIGCAVLEAVEARVLEEERYRSYLKLRRESAFYQMSYAERRKKDKKFGRMVKSAMKQVRKRKPSA